MKKINDLFVVTLLACSGVLVVLAGCTPQPPPGTRQGQQIGTHPIKAVAGSKVGIAGQRLPILVIVRSMQPTVSVSWTFDPPSAGTGGTITTVRTAGATPQGPYLSQALVYIPAFANGTRGTVTITFSSPQADGTAGKPEDFQDVVSVEAP